MTPGCAVEQGLVHGCWKDAHACDPDDVGRVRASRYELGERSHRRAVEDDLAGVRLGAGAVEVPFGVDDERRLAVAGDEDVRGFLVRA